MKVKIKDKGKVNEFNLINSWEDVTLESWTKLLKHKGKSKSDEALALISELSNIPKDIINKLDLATISVIMARIGKLQAEADNSLTHIIEIEGKRYGFHPDLECLTLGEYADIETYLKQDIDNNLPEVMAILYRPIIEEKNKVYVIEPYDGEIKIRAEEMKKMSSQQVQNALVFFYLFAKIFVRTMGLSSIEMLREMRKQ